MSNKVNLDTIKKAREVIESRIRRTPILHCSSLFEEVGNEVYFKMENLQKTGSFKIRGALNKIANLSEQEKRNGVIASSAGNHA
ncbi:MAG: pyridoxal-phosphate dependent enzyme, partial [Fusobacteriaceae bacterium]